MNRVNVASSLGNYSSRLPRGESLQPWLVIGHLYIGVLCRDNLSVLTLALGKYMIFAKSLKVKKKLFRDLSSISNSFSFSGMGNL